MNGKTNLLEKISKLLTPAKLASYLLNLGKLKKQ
jgi:hypothetical protein